MGRKFSGKCLCLAVCGGPAAQLSQAPKQRAALALASFWNVPSLKQTEHLASISCSCKHQRNIFFQEIIFTAKINLHLEGYWWGTYRANVGWEGKESKTYEATNLVSSLELRAACLWELQVARHLPEMVQKYQKSEKNSRRNVKFQCSQWWGQPEWWPPVQPTQHLHPLEIKIQPASRLFAADKPEFRSKSLRL